jgi:hypothetical protein
VKIFEFSELSNFRIFESKIMFSLSTRYYLLNTEKTKTLQLPYKHYPEII